MRASHSRMPSARGAVRAPRRRRLCRQGVPDGSNSFIGFVVDWNTGRFRLPLAPKFSVYTNFDNYIAANTWTKLQFNNSDSNDQNAFNGTNNNFTAPFAGSYVLRTAEQYVMHTKCCSCHFVHTGPSLTLGAGSRAHSQRGLRGVGYSAVLYGLTVSVVSMISPRS